uniref:Gl15 n=1 Tax=Arundo donax TaxID=35708 RepID=A0A0A9E6S5_ARUDO
MSWPILASHLPHLCWVTPRNLELPLTKPAPCRRRTWTNSSLLKFLIFFISSL